MMVSQQDKITVSQTGIVITNFLLGTGILTLPRTSVEAVKTPDVWLSVAFGGLVAILAGLYHGEIKHEVPRKNVISIQPGSHWQVAGRTFQPAFDLLLSRHVRFPSPLCYRGYGILLTGRHAALVDGDPFFYGAGSIY